MLIVTIDFITHALIFYTNHVELPQCQPRNPEHLEVTNTWGKTNPQSLSDGQDV